ncbi:MAG TPA: GPW/gp25 family protein [Myxococcota bacterium]|jgi:phage baseplate assembly protein W|nr:GPW/gp25 family protein [Myxococcota bacterium]
MPPNFLGKGWNFPVRVDRTGGVAQSEYEDNIEQAVRIILGTAIGERQMRPEFGCRIHDFVFAPNNSATAGLVSYYVHEALAKWEPRVSKIEVRARPDTMADNKLNIDITYVVRATNSIKNMVYPFYLRKPEEEAS